MTSALSEYEEQRLRNISANQEILASLGLDEATLKRDRPEQSRQTRVPQPRQQKTRVSFRHHGLEPDADAEEVDQAMQVAAAGPSLVPQYPRGPPRVPRPAVPTLTAAQRGSLAAAQGWISRMKEHYRPMLSEINLRATMQRVEELASGIGVELRGLEVPAFEGRAIRISDDLVALRQEAKAFAELDIGGWRLNHPLGKMVQFQEVLFNDGPDAAAAAEAEAEGSSWLRVGEAVEVLMTDSGLGLGLGLGLGSGSGSGSGSGLGLELGLGLGFAAP